MCVCECVCVCESVVCVTNATPGAWVETNRSFAGLYWCG